MKLLLFFINLCESINISRKIFNQVLINKIMFAEFNEDNSVNVLDNEGIQYTYHFENIEDIEKIVKKCQKDDDITCFAKEPHKNVKDFLYNAWINSYLI